MPTKEKKHTVLGLPQRDDYWMGLVFWVAAGSSCNGHGAIVVNPQQNISVAQGFDGLPPQFDFLGDVMVQHAEKAVLRSMVDFNGCTLYVSQMPCPDCLLDLIVAGIKRIVYFRPTGFGLDGLVHWPYEDKSRDIARSAYIQFDEFKGNLNWMRDRMRLLESSERIFR